MNTQSDRFEKIIAHVVTIVERDELLGLCAQSLTGLPSKSVVQEALVQMSDALSQKVADFFEQKPGSRELKQLLETLERLPVIRLTTAVTPSHRAIIRWNALCRETLQAPCVLSITKDERVVAGAIVEIQGKVFRYAVGDGIEVDGETGR